MAHPVEQRVQEWVEANLRLVSIRKPTYDHVDYIIGRHVAREEMIQVSLTAFVALVAVMRKHGSPVHAALSIPLGSDSNILAMTVPNSLQSIEDQWRKEEPPSLYLVSWDARKLLHMMEVYRRPLPFELLDPPIAGVYAFYEEGRSAEDIACDGEFTKSINAQFYPEQYWLA